MAWRLSTLAQGRRMAAMVRARKGREIAAMLAAQQEKRERIFEEERARESAEEEEADVRARAEDRVMLGEIAIEMATGNLDQRTGEGQFPMENRELPRVLAVYIGLDGGGADVRRR
jgi:hypothetical protein